MLYACINIKTVCVFGRVFACLYHIYESMEWGTVQKKMPLDGAT